MRLAGHALYYASIINHIRLCKVRFVAKTAESTNAVSNDISDRHTILSCKTLLSAFQSLIWHHGQKVLEANQVSVPPALRSSVHFTCINICSSCQSGTSATFMLLRSASTRLGFRGGRGGDGAYSAFPDTLAGLEFGGARPPPPPQHKLLYPPLALRHYTV